MNDYSIALFLHIVSAFGMFVALGIEWTGLRQLASAQDFGQIRVWMPILKNLPRFGFPSMTAAVLSGSYMTWKVWGGVSWVVVSIGALVLVMALSLVLTSPRMAAIGRALMMEKKPVPQTLQHLAGNPLLWISIQTRIAIALGIVFLKTAKPDWTGSVLTIVVAIALGIASALYATRREQVTAQEVAR